MIWLLLWLILCLGVYLAYNSASRGKSDSVMARLERFTMANEAVVQAPEVVEKEDFFDTLDKRIARAPLSVRISKELVKADLPLRVSEYMAFRFTLTSLFALLAYLFMGVLGMAFGGLLGWMAMPFYLKRKQALRQKKFAEQLEGCLVLIANSLRAGYSFLQALDLVAKEQPPPAGTEFGRVIRETTLGMDLDESLKRLGERMESNDFDFVITAVIIQRQTGGNLAEILDSIANTIRERVKLQGEIMTLTAMGRLSAGFISSLPFFLGLMFYFINKQTMKLLWTTIPGYVIIGIALLMLFMGMYAIKRVISIEV